MEEERLTQLRNLAEQYHGAMQEHRPALVEASRRLAEPVATCDVSADLDAVQRRVETVDASSLGEQVLPSFYAEDGENAMNTERRREALAKFLGVVKSDIDREKKGRAGVENLAKALKETPRYEILRLSVCHLHCLALQSSVNSVDDIRLGSEARTANRT
jgi:hypothetical protein